MKKKKLLRISKNVHTYQVNAKCICNIRKEFFYGLAPKMIFSKKRDFWGFLQMGVLFKCHKNLLLFKCCPIQNGMCTKKFKI